MRQVRRQILLGMAAAALVGCGPPTLAGDGLNLQAPAEAQCALTQENGMRLNGMRLNGMRLNGMRLNGMRLNGMRLNGMRLNGMRLNGMRLNGMRLNGMRLNGMRLNGMRLNGMRLNGAELNGMRLNGMRLNGRELNDFKLNGMRQNVALLGGAFDEVAFADFELDLVGSELVARYGEIELRGEALVGAELAFDHEGHEVLLVIDGLEVDGDVMRYSMSAQVDGGALEPLCTNARGEPDPSLRVVPLAGAWDDVTGGKENSGDGLLTLGCEGAALVKCVDMGYAPWRSESVCDGTGCRELSLEAHHQACTRMVRADYCGDGTPHTVDGTLINVYDGLGIQLDEGNPSAFTLEAEWTSGGASCLASPRLEVYRSGGCRSACIDRLLAEPVRSCGELTRFSLRDDPWSPEQTLLMSEHQR